MAAILSAGLSREQVATFGRQGYLVVEDLLGEEDLGPVIEEISAEVDRRARELVRAGELSRPYDEYGFEHRLAKINAETDKLAGSLWDGALNGPAIFNLLCNAKLLDVAESICGSELIASSVYRVRPKIPGHVKSPVPWHQDSGYFDPYCDKGMVVTVWIPLVDANEANGCLWVIPKQHDGRVVRHIWAKGKPYLEIEEADLPPGPRVCVPVRKGSVLLLTNLCPHASFENKTDKVRWSMDLRYQSAALPTNAPITRLPGESSQAVDQNMPLACYPPEADFLVRSRLRPNQVMKDAEAFRRLRMSHQPGAVPRQWERPE